MKRVSTNLLVASIALAMLFSLSTTAANSVVEKMATTSEETMPMKVEDVVIVEQQKNGDNNGNREIITMFMHPNTGGGGLDTEMIKQVTTSSTKCMKRICSVFTTCCPPLKCIMVGIGSGFCI